MVASISTDQSIIYDKIVDAICNKHIPVDIKEILPGRSSLPLSVANTFIAKLQVESKEKSNLEESADSLNRVFLELYCQGFSQKTTEEQIKYTKEHGEQVFLAEQMADSGKHSELIKHFKEFDLDPKAKISLVLEMIRQGFNIEQLFENLDKLGFEVLSVEDILNVCEEISEHAVQAYPETKFIKNISKMDLKDWPNEKRLQLYKGLLKLNEYAITELLENIDKTGILDLPLDQKLLFYKEIIHQGSGFPAANLIKHFDKLGLADATIEQRIELCLEVLKKAAAYPDQKAAIPGQIASPLVENFNTLGLEKASVEQRLNLFKEIVKYAPRSLAYSFDKFGVTGPMVEEACRMIMKSGGDTALAESLQNIPLDRNKKLELWKEIATSLGLHDLRVFSKQHFDHHHVPLDDRLAIYRVLLQRGDQYAREFGKLICKVDLEDATPEQRMNFYNEIAQKRGWARRWYENDNKQLVRYFKQGFGDISLDRKIALYKEIKHKDLLFVLCADFDQMGLEGITFEQNLDLITHFMRNGGASAIARHFDKLGLEKATPEQRLALCYEIIKNNETSSLAENIDKFDLTGTTVEQRLALYYEIIKNVDANCLARNIEKFDLTGATVEQRLAFYYEIIKNASANCLAQSIDKFDLTGAAPEQGLALCYEIIKNGGANSLAQIIDKFDLTGATVEQRLALCYDIIKNGGANGLARNIEKFDLTGATVEQRLALCYDIIKNVDAVSLAQSINKFDLIGATVEQRLAFYYEIMKNVDANGLARNIEKFDLTGATVEQRLAFYYEIMKNGGANTLVQSINKFDLAGATVEQRLALCYEIMKNSGARSLVQSIDKFGLIGATVKQRLALCYEIIQNGGANSLVQNIGKFDLTGTTLEQRLALCYEIIKYGGAASLAQSIEKFDLKGTTLEQRLALCYEIIKYGGAASLAQSIEKFDLKGTTLEQRLALCYEIIKNGGANDLAESIEKFDLTGTTLEQRLALCYEIIKNNGGSALAKQIDKFGLEKASSAEFQRLGKEIILSGKINGFTANFNKFPISAEEFLPLIALIALMGQPVNEYITLPSNMKSPSMQRQALLDLDSKPMAYTIWGPLKGTAQVYFENGPDHKNFHRYIEQNVPLLKDILKDIATKEEFLQPPLRKWVAYTACVIHDLNLTPKQMSILKESEIFNIIYHHFNIPNRFAFVRSLRDMIQKHPDDLSKLSQDTKVWVLLSTLLCSSLKSQGLSEETANELIEGIKGTSGFKDTAKLISLVQFFKSVLTFSPYKLEEMKLIIESLSQKLSAKRGKPAKGEIIIEKQIDIIASHCTSCANILQIFGKEKLLECLSLGQQPKDFFLQRFNALFTISEQKDFEENYHKTFGSFRNPMALFTYLRTVNQLPNAQRTPVKNVLNNYVNAVLQGKKKFREVRYDAANSPHLAKIFQEKPEIKKLWIDNGASTEISTTGSKTGIDYVKLLTEKIITDKHLDNDKFPLLCSFLKGEKKEPVLENPNTDEVQFQRLAIQLCNGKLEANKFVKIVRSLKIPLGEFQNDLEALIPKVSAGQFVIEETDDPCDLLLIGTEIRGSCQHIDGTPNVNKCLTASLMNGEIKAIAVKQRGKLVARSLIRLMWDEKNKTPVLLQERQYSNVTDEAVSKEIDDRAKAKAKDLGIQLVSKEIGRGPPFEGTVEYLGGTSPFIYSDATGGIQDGLKPFQVEGCHLIE